MLVPHTELVEGPLALDGTPPVEGPRPMEGLWFTLVYLFEGLFVCLHF